MVSGGKPQFAHLAMGQNPRPPVKIPIPTKVKWVVHLLQNGTIGVDPWPFEDNPRQAPAVPFVATRAKAAPRRRVLNGEGE